MENLTVNLVQSETKSLHSYLANKKDRYAVVSTIVLDGNDREGTIDGYSYTQLSPMPLYVARNMVEELRKTADKIEGIIQAVERQHNT